MFRMRALFRTVDTNHRIERFLSSAAAVCIGLAVPFSQLGKANLTGLLVAACILVTLHPKRRLWLYGAKDCLLTPVGIAVAMVFLAWIPSVLAKSPGREWPGIVHHGGGHHESDEVRPGA